MITVVSVRPWSSDDKMNGDMIWSHGVVVASGVWTVVWFDSLERRQDERQEMIWSHGVVVASGVWITVVSVRFRLVPLERRQDERQEMQHTVWSRGQDSWLSTSRLGFKSRYRNLLLTWRNRKRTRLRTGRLQVQVLPWALTLTVDLMGMVPQPVS